MELEEIKYKLTQNQYDFFLKFKEYIESPIYFIGSVLRYDYFKGHSDLDIIIFSPNIDSMKLKIKNFLNLDKKDKFIYLNINKAHISGYKFNYNDSLKGEKHLCFDLSVFKENTKKILINYKNQKDMSFIYIIYFLIIKTLHYYIGIINNHTYSFLKSFIWEVCNRGINPMFIYYHQYKIIYENNYPNNQYMVDI